MVWPLQFGQLVVLCVNMCGMAVIICQLLVLSPSICGMAVPIRSTDGFVRKNVWYGC